MARTPRRWRPRGLSRRRCGDVLFLDAPLGAGPQSITMIVSMDSGLSLREPRNDGRLFLPDLALGPRLQPLDVLAVRVKTQQRQDDEQRGQRRVAEPPQEQRRDEGRNQRR